MAYVQQEIILNGRTYELEMEEKIIKNQLEERYSQEEVLWIHKSKVQWLKQGERNTTFFHKYVIQCRQINKITRLHNSQGGTVQSHWDI